MKLLLSIAAVLAILCTIGFTIMMLVLQSNEYSRSVP